MLKKIDLICWNVAGDGPSQIQIIRLSSLSDSNSVTHQRTPTQWTPVLSEEESRQGWCQFFVREKAKLLEGTWDVKLVPANHSVVALHAHQQHTPPISSVCGMKYREGIIADYEKACMSRGSCQNKPCGLDIQVIFHFQFSKSLKDCFKFGHNTYFFCLFYINHVHHLLFLK